MMNKVAGAKAVFVLAAPVGISMNGAVVVAFAEVVEVDEEEGAAGGGAGTGVNVTTEIEVEVVGATVLAASEGVNVLV